MDVSLRHKELREQIIKAFYGVYNLLGYGFLESVYEEAMEIELSHLGLISERQAPIKEYFRKQIVGEFFVDLE